MKEGPDQSTKGKHLDRQKMEVEITHFLKDVAELAY